MDNQTLMNWQAFRSTLLNYPEHLLQFEYAADKWVDASYHITEIKQAPVVSVDCGGVMNSWTEIIVQLWEPSVSEEGRSMQVSKAMSIVDIVEKQLPLNPHGIVKIEFGNSQFDTRQMYPASFTQTGANLVVNLSPDQTQCKAINRGESCGTTSAGEACCTPTEIQQKPKKEMINIAIEKQHCTPGSGCC